MELSIYARQGDLVIEEIREVPMQLEIINSPKIIAGSHGKEHTLPAGIGYGQDGRNHFVSVINDCMITHASTHRPVPLLKGKIYKIYPQIERHGEYDVDVED